ncbi:MAG: citramalate synthase [Deferribacteraceae bacterium]|jgi:2-isopropylmalate synthase|nr:citramalate synthase [Deferribacteraceae bacterium]
MEITLADKVFIYDTTLRDGTQAEEVNFTVNDKLRIAKRLIDFGIDCVEGGWPGSNQRDIEFFERLNGSDIPKDKISAFSSTRRAKMTCEEDKIIQSLLAADVPNLTIFGKSWDMHVTEALKISLDENLELIGDTVQYLKRRADKVYFDAEHFFDGYKANPEYALKVLETAAGAGADCLVLCETNGGTLPDEIINIINAVNNRHPGLPLGIHCHNDCESAVANSILAVKYGARHVQGTINGLGERCGNANLCSIIPNLQLKYGYECVPAANLQELRELSLFVNELGNITPSSRQPYVGRSAFAHKGGVHVSAIMKNAATYEHIRPESVGNTQRVLLSDLSGRSNLVYKANSYGLDVDNDNYTELLAKLKYMENKGYEYEGAEASFELLILSAMGKVPHFFDLISYRVIDEKRSIVETPLAEATVMLSVNGEVEHTAATGNGPVNALDNAVRKALIKFYPTLKDMSLVDYKVRILDGSDGTGALTRVLMESNDDNSSWSTVGVAANIVDASYQALVDSIQYKLYRDTK